MKVLSPRAHGFLDFVVVLGFLVAPSLFDFSGTAATVSYVLAAVHLGMTLLTDFPMGIVKAIPFTLHGTLEFVIALTLVALPWVLDFDRDMGARNFYVGAALVIFAVWLTTDYQAAGRTVAHDKNAGIGGTWSGTNLQGR